MEGKPPIDVYENIIIEDPDNYNYGFIAEGVNDEQGFWAKIGMASSGDFLWVWIFNDEDKDTIKNKKDRGWALRGNKPIFMNPYWIIMGLNPAILYFTTGNSEKIEDIRIEVEEAELKVNKTILIPSKLIDLKSLLNKEKKIFSTNEEIKATPLAIDQDIMNLCLSEAATPEIQIKNFFPLIELTDAMFAEVSQIEAFAQFAKRINFFITNPVNEFNIFTIQNGDLNFIHGNKPIEDKIHKIKQLSSLKDDAVSTENSLLFKKCLGEKTLAVMLWFNNSLSLEDANDTLKHLKNTTCFMDKILRSI